MAHDDSSDRARARCGGVLCEKWRLDELLGVGGMAAVYAATHRNRKRVAIKILHAALAADPEVRGRFAREGYVANSIAHPGATTVDDDDVTSDGCPFLVMELVEGRNLEQERLRAGGVLAPDVVLPIAAQLLDVLTAAHGCGVVHRDLKPENLMLTPSARLKVLDFGLARARELPADSCSVTAPSSVLGTPHYMAPEQALGRSELVDERTDLWAVGATMFVLLSGEHVHPAAGLPALLVQAATEPARSIGAVAPELARSLVDLVDRALTFSKNERFADARTMLEALRVVARELSIELPAPVERRPRSVPAETVPPAGLSSRDPFDASADTSLGPSAMAGGEALPAVRRRTWRITAVGLAALGASTAVAATVLISARGAPPSARSGARDVATWLARSAAKVPSAGSLPSAWEDAVEPKPTGPPPGAPRRAAGARSPDVSSARAAVTAGSHPSSSAAAGAGSADAPLPPNALDRRK